MQAAAKRRADYILRQQLEDQRKAYDELRRKVEMLQSGQELDVSRTTDGSYAELVQMRDMPPLSIKAGPLDDKANDDIKHQVHYSYICLAEIRVGSVILKKIWVELNLNRQR